VDLPVKTFAKNVYLAIRKAFDASVSFPKHIYQNRHVVLMGYFTGYNLVDIASLDGTDMLLKYVFLEVRMRAHKDVVVYSE